LGGEKEFFEERDWDIREMEKRKEERDVWFVKLTEADRKIKEVAEDKGVEVV